MIRITQKAETEITSLMKAIKAGVNAHTRCVLHIKGGVLGDKLLTQLPPLLDKWIADPQGYIFTCEDRDVFIFASVITEKFHTRLRTLIAEQSLLPSRELEGICALYDTHTHGTAIEAMIDEKIKKIEERLANDAEKRKCAALAAQLNSELKDSIPQRRAGHKTTQILVIEDDPFSRRMVGLALKPEIEPSTSETGIQGLWDYMALAPHLVFLDINLPDISGHEVLERILKMDPDANIVMLSSAGSAENVMHAADHGARGFVGKPFARHKIQQYVSKIPIWSQKKKA